MKKNAIKITFALVALAMLFTGCRQAGVYDYDLNRYITMGDDYKNLTLEIESMKITDQDVTNYINTSLLEEEADVEIVESGVLKNGDIANIDFVGYMDGVPFENGSGENFDLTLGSHSFIEGFEEGLVGAKIGDKVSLDLTFPDSYWNADMRSKEVTFEVKVNHVTKKDYPELTDELVKKISKGQYLTVKPFLAYVKESMEAQAKQYAENQKSKLVWAKLASQVEVKKYPQNEINSYIKNGENYYKLRAKASNISYEEYIQRSYDATPEEFRETLRVEAENTIKEEMICFEIVKREGITITEAEIASAAQSYMSQYNVSSITELDTTYGKGVAKKWALMDKALKFVLDNATIVEK